MRFPPWSILVLLGMVFHQFYIAIMRQICDPIELESRIGRFFTPFHASLECVIQWQYPGCREINQSGDGISMVYMDDHQLKIALDTGPSNASDVAVQICGALLRMLRWWHDFDTRTLAKLYLHARLTSLDRILPTICVSVRVFF